MLEHSFLGRMRVAQAMIVIEWLVAAVDHSGAPQLRSRPLPCCCASRAHSAPCAQGVRETVYVVILFDT